MGPIIREELTNVSVWRVAQDAPKECPPHRTNWAFALPGLDLFCRSRIVSPFLVGISTTEICYIAVGMEGGRP